MANAFGGHWALVATCHGMVWDGLFGPKDPQPGWQFDPKKGYVEVFKRNYGELSYGDYSGTPCSDATTDQMINCILKKPRFEEGGPYDPGEHDCQTDVSEALGNCCLTSGRLHM